MIVESQYTIDGECYNVVAERRDMFFGHGLKLTIYRSNGELWAKSTCNCHIEFDGFNECQQLNTNELLSIAVHKLINGWHSSIEKGKESGLTVMSRLNG